MASADLGSTEWERSKISPQDINLLKKLGISKKQDALRFPNEESYPTPPMEYRPSMKEFLRLGTQFIGYRDYVAKLEGTLAEANKRADALAIKLEQSETARKKAEADAAAVEDLRKRLHDAENSLSDNIAQQSARENEILTGKRSKIMIWRTLKVIAFSTLFPSLKSTGMRRVKVLPKPASQQDVDWARVGDTKEMETKRWQSLIKAAKPNSKKILAYLGCKPTPAPSSSKPEVK
ncbi:hypothetical protein QYE76_001742 [Lolium multiflorum]|uniref:Uncharacterized protein n=1 Tax=Lolium multiflorum TaxID=4521 RepID=A0AAD8RMP4_LOLMU|nr:hypothetical protein QYE76_001742 [Lolium multiflorum]